MDLFQLFRLDSDVLLAGGFALPVVLQPDVPLNPSVGLNGITRRRREVTTPSKLAAVTLLV